ncbi:MAG: hypothetical protein IJA23_02225, partial [Clostridia bacterium]|nr:hypothetical protein [Clostridia bacterium]
NNNSSAITVSEVSAEGETVKFSQPVSLSVVNNVASLKIKVYTDATKVTVMGTMIFNINFVTAAA